jgi:hypothetical protein
VHQIASATRRLHIAEIRAELADLRVEIADSLARFRRARGDPSATIALLAETRRLNDRMAWLRRRAEEFR